MLVGALSAGLSNLNGFKRTKLLFFVKIWTFFGILLRNLYQGVFTETLIFPTQYETNLTLESMIRKNFTLMMIPELTEDSKCYDYNHNSIKENAMDFLFYKYLLGTFTKFFRKFLRSFVFKIIDHRAYHDLVVNKCDRKLENCESWNHLLT